MDAYTAVSFVFAALLIFLYLAFILYLAFVMYSLSRFGLFVLVLLGSFTFPIVLPIVMVILLGCGVISEQVRTVIA
jgi:hypothetical protein